MQLTIFVKADVLARELELVNLGLHCFEDALLLSVPVNDGLSLVTGETLRFDNLHDFLDELGVKRFLLNFSLIVTHSISEVLNPLPQLCNAVMLLSQFLQFVL